MHVPPRTPIAIAKHKSIFDPNETFRWSNQLSPCRSCRIIRSEDRQISTTLWRTKQYSMLSKRRLVYSVTNFSSIPSHDWRANQQDQSIRCPKHRRPTDRVDSFCELLQAATACNPPLQCFLGRMCPRPNSKWQRLWAFQRWLCKHVARAYWFRFFPLLDLLAWSSVAS